jgi:hypothetical protein
MGIVKYFHCELASSGVLPYPDNAVQKQAMRDKFRNV